jgi:hypothetical protein
VISDFLEAVRRLTILPVPPSKREREAVGSLLFFPGVGALVALFSVAAVQILSLSLFSRLEALGLVTIPILLTGGRPLRGLADLFENLSAVAIPLILFWKWELLVVLPAREKSLLLALTASRWAPLALAYFLPAAQASERPGLRELIGATALFSLVVVILGGAGILCFLALLPLLAGLWFLYSRGKVGRMTLERGGVTSEATELFILLSLFLASRGGIS